MFSIYREVTTVEDGVQETRFIWYTSGIKETTIDSLKEGKDLLLPSTYSEEPQLTSLSDWGLKIKEISDYLTVNVTVPVYQNNPQFGENNKNLQGKKVISEIILGEKRNVIVESFNLFYPPNNKVLKFSNTNHTDAELSSDALKLKQFYLELLSFKSNDLFHKYGFSPDRNYNSWLKNCEGISKESNIINDELHYELAALGVNSQDIIFLGMEYLHSYGNETELSINIRSKFDKAFNVNSGAFLQNISTKIQEHSDYVNVSIRKYLEIKTGMLYGDVVSILGGPGVEVSRSELRNYSLDGSTLETITYQWVNPNGSNMNAIFQNGKLIQKAQFGLE